MIPGQIPLSVGGPGGLATGTAAAKPIRPLLAGRGRLRRDLVGEFIHRHHEATLDACWSHRAGGTTRIRPQRELVSGSILQRRASIRQRRGLDPGSMNNDGR